MSRVCTALLVLVASLAVPAAGALAGELIGVPPFVNATGDRALDWVGEGMASTLTAKLNQVVSLTAVDVSAERGARLASTVTLKPEDLADVPAGVVIIGTVVRAGDAEALDADLEVVVRIVDTATSRQRGSLEIRGKMAQLFPLEADLAAQVVKLFGIQLTPAEEESLLDAETRSLIAYKETVLGALYLREGRFENAIALLEQALGHHPGIFYPRAHALLGRAYAAAGRQGLLLERFKKDVAQLAPAFFDLGRAQEENGKFEEALGSYRLYLKYTGQRVLHWRRRGPEMDLLALLGDTVILRRPGGELEALDLATGAPRTAPAAATTAREATTLLDASALAGVTHSEHAVVGPLTADGRRYLALDNGYLIGIAPDGTRAWSYKTPGVPRSLLLAEGRLLVSDRAGWVSCIGIHGGGETTEVTAYLRLAAVAERLGRHEDAESIYRHVVEEVQFNVPEAWRALEQIAGAAGRGGDADSYRANIEKASF